MDKFYTEMNSNSKYESQVLIRISIRSTVVVEEL